LSGIQKIDIPDIWIGVPQGIHADPETACDFSECVANLNNIRAVGIGRGIIVVVWVVAVAVVTVVVVITVVIIFVAAVRYRQDLTGIQISADAGVGIVQLRNGDAAHLDTLPGVSPLGRYKCFRMYLPHWRRSEQPGMPARSI